MKKNPDSNFKFICSLKPLKDCILGTKHKIITKNER